MISIQELFTVCLLYLTFAMAKDFKRFKNATIENAKTIDELTLPKTLIECCGACVLSKSCKGVKFDGATCTRLCDFTYISTGIGNNHAYIDYSILKGTFNSYFFHVLDYLPNFR